MVFGLEVGMALGDILTHQQRDAAVETTTLVAHHFPSQKKFTQVQRVAPVLSATSSSALPEIKCPASCARTCLSFLSLTPHINQSALTRVTSVFGSEQASNLSTS